MSAPEIAPEIAPDAEPDEQAGEVRTPAPAVPPRKPLQKGFYCPDCRGVRLAVTTTEKACPGLIVRYRRCSACGLRIVTEERVARTRRPRTKERS